MADLDRLYKQLVSELPVPVSLQDRLRRIDNIRTARDGIYRPDTSK